MNDILRLSVPLTAWLASFSAVYGLQGLVCSDRWGEAALGVSEGRIALILAWLVGIAVQVALLLALRSPRFASRSDFVRWTSQALAMLALAATVWTLLPAVTLSLCL